MSTSPATETTQPPTQDNLSSEPNIEPIVANTSQLSPAEQNISEQTTLTTTNEHNDCTKSQELPLNVQPESEVTSTENMESNAPLAESTKMPEENKVDNVVEKDVQQSKTEVQETPEENKSIANTAQTINDPTPSNEKIEADKGKNIENGEAEKQTIHNEEPSTVNENSTQRNPVPDNQQQDEDRYTSECVNIQELTEHVMNILNDDGVVENAMSEKQLLQKNVDLQQFIVKLIHLLKEKTDLCANLDRQNSALISQAKSLKDVIAITKDLLGIRNMEIEHLHADMAAMEDSIKEERNRHNLSVQRLNEAMTLNDKLKTEYLTQMDLFQKLREKYNEKVVYLTRENQRLNGLMNPDAQAAEGNTNEVNDQSNQVESVDK